MLIGDNIKRIRLLKNMTQKQVADACGVADSTLRVYERNRANPKPATVAKIAKALGVPPSALYGIGQIPGTGTLAPETESALCASFLVDASDTVSADTAAESFLLTVFGKLNELGQREAIKRVNELSFVPIYQKGDESP